MHRQTCEGAGLPCPVLLSLLRPRGSPDPSDYVVTPIVEEGEREIDFKLGSAWFRDGTRETAWSIGLGYGATIPGGLPSSMPSGTASPA